MSLLETWVPRPGPVREFAVVNLVNTVGSGLFLAGGSLFFTRGLGLPVQTVALGLSMGVGVGLLVSVGFGRLADRYTPRPVYVGLLVLQALAMTSYPFVQTEAQFLALAVVSGIADRGIAGTVGAVIQGITGGTDRVRVRAQLRSTTNVGLAFGALLAGIALSWDTELAYAVLVWCNALIFAAAAVMVRNISMGSPAPRLDHAQARPFTDRPYLIVTLLNGLLSLHVSTLSFALPLWVAASTDAPLWVVSAMLAINTVLVVVLQAPLSGLASDFSRARRSAILAGTALALSCLTMALTPSTRGLETVAVLLIWIVIFTFGELTQASCQFFVGFEMAPDHAQGAYQSVFALGPGIMRAAAPLLLSAVVLSQGARGWLVLAVGFCLTGAGLAMAVRPPTGQAPLTESTPMTESVVG